MEIEVGIESDKSKSDIMSVLNFINWVQSKYTLPNRTTAVKKAAELMKVREITIWQWLRGARQPDASKILLMCYIVAYGPLDDDSGN